ncbi:MAG: helix-turn-helix domain-containing protein [Lachnospiraceae bacterium]
MVQGLGEKLQRQRISMNISQKEAAAAIQVSPSIISNYESGERTPSVEKLMALANLYHCSCDYLLGLERNNRIDIDTSMLTDHQVQLLQNFLFDLKK